MSIWKSLLARWRALPGFAILVGCFLAGQAVKDALGLIVPANIIGLFLLLGLFGAGVVRPRWVEEAAGALLFVLPLLFLPIFVNAAEDRSFWVERGVVYSVAVVAGLLAMWALVGHLAQFLFKRFPSGEGLPGPLTEAEVAAEKMSAQG